MPKELVTAESVTQAILHCVTTGQYIPGDRLPSARDLAEEIGSNRNTVNKAYQVMLGLGVISTITTRPFLSRCDRGLARL